MGGPRLTAQELANIVAWKKQGYTNRQIGRRLGRTPITAPHVMMKLNPEQTVYRNCGTTIDFGNVKPESYVRRSPRRVSPQMEFTPIAKTTTTYTVRENTDAVTLVITSGLDRETKLKLLGALL